MRLFHPCVFYLQTLPHSPLYSFSNAWPLNLINCCWCVGVWACGCGCLFGGVYMCVCVCVFLCIACSMLLACLFS